MKKIRSKKDLRKTTFQLGSRKEKRLNTLVPERLKTETEESMHYLRESKPIRSMVLTAMEAKRVRKNAVVARNEKYSEQCETIKRDLMDDQNDQRIGASLRLILEIIGSISLNMFSYNTFQQQIKAILSIVKSTRSLSFVFRTYVLAGLGFYQFANFNLSIYYFDQSLKALYDRSTVANFQRKYQLVVYKTVAKIFLQKHLFEEAREMAYKFLRKSWFLSNVDFEMEAFDILGQIYNELQNWILSKYFHHRMCQGISEAKQLIKMSNLQLQKAELEKQQFCVFDDISNFVRSDLKFHSILSKGYESDAFKHMKASTGFHISDTKIGRSFLLTHRSPNRVIRNYHVLDTKRAHETTSKQLHFIREKEVKNLKKLYVSYGKLIFNIKNSLQQKKRFVTEEEHEYEPQEEVFEYHNLKAFRA